jgi:hypothetical protein
MSDTPKKTSRFSRAEIGSVKPVMIHLFKEDMPLIRDFGERNNKTISQIAREGIKIYITEKSDAYKNGYEDGLIAATAILRRKGFNSDKLNDFVCESACKEIEKFINK